jgi:hypothetical protein
VGQSDSIEWRRSTVLELSSEGYSQRDRSKASASQPGNYDRYRLDSRKLDNLWPSSRKERSQIWKPLKLNHLYTYKEPTFSTNIGTDTTEPVEVAFYIVIIIDVVL